MRACAEANNLPEGRRHGTLGHALHGRARPTTTTRCSSGGSACTATTPTCVSACLVGAFTKTETGAVLYDEIEVHRLPLLHAGLSVRGPAVRMGKPHAADPEMPHVLRARGCGGGQTACAEACLVGCDDIRRPRRPDQRGPEADRREPGTVCRLYLRTAGSGRDLGPVPLGDPVRAARIPDERAEGADSGALLARPVADPEIHRGRRRGALRHPLDHGAAHGSRAGSRPKRSADSSYLLTATAQKGDHHEIRRLVRS